MKLLTVAIERKKTKEFLWGIDTKTMQFFYTELLDEVREKNKSVGDVLIFKEEMVKGTHELKLNGPLEIETNDRDYLINTLDCMASYPACIKERFVKSNVLKIRKIHNLERFGDRVDATIEIYGIDGQYKAKINDSKWVNFWKDSSSGEMNERDFIDVVNRMKSVYLILDFTQTFFGNELVFSGMVLEFG